MATPQMPDIEDLAIDHLVADPQVTGDVVPELPANPTYPLTVIERKGGVSPDDRWLDVATLQIDVRGDTKAQANDEARAVLASLLDMTGTQPAGGVVTRVRTTLGLQWLPDDVSGQARYTALVAVTAHP